MHAGLENPGTGGTAVRARRGEAFAAPATQRRQVIGTTGLGAQAHGGTLPAAEGLPLHDRTGDPAVHVQIARLDPIHPVQDLVRIQGMDAGGQAVVHGVLQFQGVVQIVRAHQAQHRTEALGQVEERTGPHTRADTGAPQLAGIVQLLGLDQPFLAGLELGECFEQLALGLLHGGTHGSLKVIGPRDHHGGRGVDELAAEPIGGRHGADQDAQRSRRALLARMTEGAGHQVPHGLVTVRTGGDHQGVLTGGLRGERALGEPIGEELSGLVRTGQHHAFHVRVGDECLTGVTFHGVHQLQHIAGHTGLPQRLTNGRRAATGFRGRLVNHGRTCGQRRHGGAGGNRDREVPRRGHHGHAVRDELTAIHELQLQGAARVVAAEVHGLRNFRVALFEHLTGLGAGNGQKMTTASRQDVAGAVENLGAFTGGGSRPGRAGGLGSRDDVVHGLDRPARVVLDVREHFRNG